MFFGNKSDSSSVPCDMELFTIFDTKSGSYRDPVLAPNSGVLMRDLHASFRKFPDDQYFTNAEDFQLFKVGEFTRKTGTLVGCPPVHIANLHDVKHAFLKIAQFDQNPPRALSPT